jgi:cyclophilin family peptidyl-prolyl cis-trans isomerase
LRFNEIETRLGWGHLTNLSRNDLTSAGPPCPLFWEFSDMNFFPNFYGKAASSKTRRIARAGRRISIEELEQRVVFNVHPAGATPRHIHTHVSIYIDGDNFVIPASVGHAFPGPLIGTANEDAHTHTDDGIIHFNEGTPLFRDLKEFFDTWGAEFTQNRIRLPNPGGGFTERTVDAGHVLRFQVNGAASPDFENYEPEDGDQIVISYEAIAATNTPRLNPIAAIQLASNTDATSPARIFSQPLDAADPNGLPLTYTVTSSNSSVVATLSPASNRSLRLNVTGKDISGNDFTGDIVLELFEDLAPQSTARIIQLASQGSYNGTTFHRVLKDFVAQGGDLTTGGPGGTVSSIADEFNAGLTFNGFGQLAMANSGDDTNTSQFFVTDTNLSLLTGADSAGVNPPQSLNFNHSIIGQLTSGFDAFNKLMFTPTSNNGQGELSRPNNTVRVNTATVFNDDQRAVLRLAAAPNTSGTSDIKVTVSNSNNQTAEREFLARIVADTVNDRPFLGSITNPSTSANTPVTISLPATDLENDTLTFVIRDPNNFANSPPNVSVSIDQGTRQATLTPANGFTGTISMLVGVRDATQRAGANASADAQANFDTQLIQLTVGTTANQRPVANAQTVQVQGTTAANITLTGDDGDLGATQTLSFIIDTLPTGGTLRDSSNNAIAVGNVLTSGSLTYTPNAISAGSDMFTFRVRDNGGVANGGVDTSLPATVTLNRQVNGKPTATAQSVQFQGSNPVTITLAGDDGDPNATQALTFTIVTLPSGGTLRDSANNTINAGATITGNTVTYTANAGSTANDTFTFRVRDDGGTAGGGVDTSDVATITLQSQTNTRPIANAQTIQLTNGTSPVSITLTGDDGDSGATQTLSFIVDTLPTGGTLRDSAGNAVTAGTALPSATLSYTRNATATGSDSFTFRVQDNGGTTGGGVDTSTPATISLTAPVTTPTGPAAPAPKMRGSTLFIRGTRESDTIDVSFGSTPATIQVVINGNAPSVMDSASVSRIQIMGRDGNDTINVSEQIQIPTKIRGGRGNDIINGGGGNDSIYGDAGNDTIAGRGGHDALRGGGGNDSIQGGVGDDMVRGGAGNDTIVDNAGTNSLRGGAGSDTINPTPSTGGNNNGIGSSNNGNGANGNPQPANGIVVAARESDPDLVLPQQQTQHQASTDAVMALTQGSLGTSLDETLLSRTARNRLRGGATR